MSGKTAESIREYLNHENFDTRVKIDENSNVNEDEVIFVFKLFCDHESSLFSCSAMWLQLHKLVSITLKEKVTEILSLLIHGAI